MKFNLRKNKLMLINTICLLISFIVFFIFLHIINYDWDDEGHYSPMSALIAVLSLRYDPEYIIQDCFVGYIPSILITYSLVYFIALFVLLRKKETQIKYSSLLVYQSIYLIVTVYNYMLDVVWFKGCHFDVYLSSEMLLPIIAFSVYYLVCIVIFYVKDKKKAAYIEKVVDTEKDNII